MAYHCADLLLDRIVTGVFLSGVDSFAPAPPMWVGFVVRLLSRHQPLALVHLPAHATPSLDVRYSGSRSFVRLIDFSLQPVFAYLIEPLTEFFTRHCLDVRLIDFSLLNV